MDYILGKLFLPSFARIVGRDANKITRRNILVIVICVVV
jgi:hypothetical protein